MILSGGCSQLFHNLVLVDIQKTQIRKETHYKQVLIYNIHNTKQNKYAIHAYTHGPVTGSGPSVVWP